MPYSIEHLLEKQADLTLARPDDLLADALDCMGARDYSQLPVADGENRLLGLVTYESSMRAVRHFHTPPDQLLVRDALVPAARHYREDDLFDLLDELQRANAVVIVAPEGQVLGIITSYDTSAFLRERSEDLMRVEEVEFTVKELLRQAGPRARDGQIRAGKAFDELTLADYINLLTAKDTWALFAPILEIEREALCALLESVRRTRNHLAHFRDEVSPESRNELRACANWLRNQYRDYEKRREGERAGTLRSVREALAAYLPRSGESRYAALAGWLAQQPDERVALTFAQVEEILGTPLPASARASRAWWARQMPWQAAGWQTRYADLEEELVVFARPAAT